MSGSVETRLSDHIPRMYRVALRMIGNPDKANEVVQDACVKALRGLVSFDGRSMPATWLHRITVNCATDHLRKHVRERGRQIQADLTETLMAGPSPAAQAERCELYELAARLVTGLSDDCREAFVLTQLDGYSYDEAAVITRQPRGTVASRVCRAKRILLDQLHKKMTRRTES